MLTFLSYTVASFVFLIFVLNSCSNRGKERATATSNKSNNQKSSLFSKRKTQSNSSRRINESENQSQSLRLKEARQKGSSSSGAKRRQERRKTSQNRAKISKTRSKHNARRVLRPKRRHKPIPGLVLGQRVPKQIKIKNQETLKRISPAERTDEDATIQDLDLLATFGKATCEDHNAAKPIDPGECSTQSNPRPSSDKKITKTEPKKTKFRTELDSTRRNYVT